MIMRARIQTAIDRLLEIEHVSFGVRLGLLASPAPILERDLVKELVYAIDELAWSPVAEDQKSAVQLMGITWEAADVSMRPDLREFFVVTLSRIGVSPSAVMLDASARETGQFEALSSYSAELAAMSLQLKNKVVIGSSIHFLSRFQKDVLDHVSANPVVGISAPTSAGKSHALYLSVARHALNGLAPVVFIVPTISLVNQVSADVSDMLAAHGAHNWTVHTSFGNVGERRVFVVTQERALAGLSEADVVPRIGLLIVDEVQNLERVAEDSDLRAKILFDCLKDLTRRTEIDRAVISGPRLNNVGDVARRVFGGEPAEIHAVQSPVASLTYSIRRSGDDLLLRQHSDLTLSVPARIIDNAEIVTGMGELTYSDDFIAYVSRLLRSLGPGSRNIVFSPTADQARKTACGLSGFESARPGLEELSSYIASAIHPRHSLVVTTRKGVAFHSGSVPPHVRMAIEQAFSDGLLKDLVCTTTLMQGVNLPATTVIVRNPKLFTRQSAGAPSLSPYEFANLRGRAGRLMRDFVGRTLVLDEESFGTTDAQADMFDDVKKELTPGYAGMFREQRESILAEIQSPGSIEEPGPKFVATYIRQAVLREAGSARERLIEVGIDLGAREFRRVEQSLERLSIPREVCLANRYWDPFDLQKIADNAAGEHVEDIPESPWQGDVAGTLAAWLQFQRVVSPMYFDRHLRGDGRVMLLAKTSEEWAREIPLRNIVEQRHFKPDEQAKLEDFVSIIYKRIVYGVPALLKPVADIRGKGRGLLAAIESGTFHGVTRRLVERGLHRETAVLLKRSVLPNVRADADNLDSALISTLLGKRDGMDRWVRRQVDPVLDQWIRELEHA